MLDEWQQDHQAQNNQIQSQLTQPSQLLSQNLSNNPIRHGNLTRSPLTGAQTELLERMLKMQVS